MGHVYRYSVLVLLLEPESLLREKEPGGQERHTVVAANFEGNNAIGQFLAILEELWEFFGNRMTRFVK